MDFLLLYIPSIISMLLFLWGGENAILLVSTKKNHGLSKLTRPSCPVRLQKNFLSANPCTEKVLTLTSLGIGLSQIPEPWIAVIAVSA